MNVMGQADGAGGSLTKLFDMHEGIPDVRNVLGVGDPDVHLIGGRWCMFLGGFQTSFRNGLFLLRLPPGAHLGSDEWRFDTVAGKPRRARPLISQPHRSAWDGYGLHEPCYVKGRLPDRHGVTERVYYTGRSSRRVAGNTSPYAIGFLERTPLGWTRHPDPVITGAGEWPNALGAHVRYFAGKWRVWFCSTPKLAGKGEIQRNRIQYAESEDGVNWSSPCTLFGEDEGYYHAVVEFTDAGYEMVATNGPNLYQTPGYPTLGMWLLRSQCPSGRRQDWSHADPVLIAQPDMWYANGIFGPSVVYGEVSGTKVRHIFFSGVHARSRWSALAGARLRRGHRPPVPAPFYFAVGRLTMPLDGTKDGLI